MVKWINSGSPWIWLSAAAVSLSLLIVIGLVGLIGVRGLVHFWPTTVYDVQYQVSESEQIRMVGEIRSSAEVPLRQIQESGQFVASQSALLTRHLFRTGNRDLLGVDFTWLVDANITERTVPENALVLERMEWGNFYGFLKELKQDGKTLASGNEAWQQLMNSLELTEQLQDQIYHIEKSAIGSTNYQLEKLRLKTRKLELEGGVSPSQQKEIAQLRAELLTQFDGYRQQLIKLHQEIDRQSVVAEIADGRIVEISLAKIVKAYRPNAMSALGKIGFFFAKIWEFLSTDPREANTEGGIFPAIFGTVLMVLVMSVIVTPLGIIAAVYLREYAHQGVFTRTVRIAVNNLAGVPSIVYGVFGLGFFVYFLGGSIDSLFYPEALPAPTFGTPGLLWSSLTLALLTVPVVIVATEEGLTRIPRSLREASYALGATQADTLWRVILPMTRPAMITGLILAVARAAGEVAPLMLVGVVKLAPTLPLDGNSPFLHLDRKFMHLGFHIYDVGFQSPNVEAARPLVYATSLLLVIVVMVLNMAAIRFRNRLNEQYAGIEA